MAYPNDQLWELVKLTPQQLAGWPVKTIKCRLRGRGEHRPLVGVAQSVSVSLHELLCEHFGKGAIYFESI